MTTPRMHLSDWQQFVLANGWRVPTRALSAVLGQPVEEVERVRRTGACTRLKHKCSFAELFRLWHGRAPRDEEWPVPCKLGACGTYEWQAPEIALLASLVGTLGSSEIATILTNRLREKTGDPNARRTRVAVQVRINAIGMQSTDVLGGITTAAAGREIGSLAIVHHAIHNKQLPARRVGRLWVIPVAAWAEWKSKRTFPPKDYKPLRSIRQGLAIRSDKLSEMARLGYVPTALRCNPYGTRGPSTQFGTWYIHKKVAAKLLADRRAGRPMPWHGKPLADNLRTTFRLWEKRRHPASCVTCAEIWGKNGVPLSYEDYALRYPPLAHGAKRHLTRPWSPGLTTGELAVLAGCSVNRVRRAIENGALFATHVGRRNYVSRTDATRWRARKCPTGESNKCWISLNAASTQYLFTMAELRRFIRQKKLKSKVGTAGAMRGVVYIPRHQCALLRERIGLTEEQAAKRAGVSLAKFRRLVRGVNWRKANGIPLVTVKAVIKRLESREGYTVAEAAAAVDMPVEWVHARKLDGTIRVTRAKWDNRRSYITEPMLQRLKNAKNNPTVSDRLSRNRLRLSEAAYDAGVSTGTLLKWARSGDLDRQWVRDVWRYNRRSVRVRARHYWKSVRFHRATPPGWFRAERNNDCNSRSTPMHGSAVRAMSHYRPQLRVEPYHANPQM